jgi:superfamily II DNA or RNA helicase
VSVKDTVRREIKKCYGKDSVVIDYNGKEDCLDAIDKNKFNYILINYDKFRTSDILEEPIMNLVKLGEVDFIVLDEIQRAKKMEDSRESNTYRYLKTMRMEAQKHNPKLKVLGLSATPFKNDLTELHSVLELLSGVSPKFKTRNKTIKNKVFARYELFENGIRISGNSDFDVKVNTYFTETNGNSIKENLISQDKMSWSVVDMALTKIKLDSIADEIKSKTIIYSISTISIPVIESWVKEKGFTYEIYTGETDVRDRNSILEDKFINGDCDIIIASSPIGTGIDGLQKCCKRIVILSLPWTNADYVQLIGRIARRGSMFSEVDVYIPQVAINLKSGEIWSWDRRRFDFIRTKRILSEQILCGFYNEETEEISSGFLELFTENALSDLRKGEE